MKTIHPAPRAVLLLAVFVSSFLLLPSAFPQGTLTPPPGAPTPTFKTLQQVEPRTDLQAPVLPPGVTTDASYHFIINQPGSYYLSANLDVTKPHGIDVRAAGVTIDLNGFQIRRTSGSGGNGIEIDATSHRCTVKNGSISGFAVGGHCLGSSNHADGGSFLQLAVSGCSTSALVAGDGWEIDGCKVHDNSGDIGIDVPPGGTLTNCTLFNNVATLAIFADAGCTLTNVTAVFNAGEGIRTGSYNALTNCTAYFNGSRGIVVGHGSTLTNCAAGGNDFEGINAGSGSVLTNCSARDNDGSYGIFAATGSTLTNCTAMDNTGIYGIFAGEGSTLNGCTAFSNDVEHGIHADLRSTITNCTASGNNSAAADSWGISADAQSTISNCTASGNLNTNATPLGSTGGGILAGISSTVQNCTAAGNKGDGIQISSDARVIGNNCDSNGFPPGTGSGAGIHSTGSDNRIEANNVTDNTRGIEVESSGSLVIKNSASANSINYVIAADNVNGPIINRTVPASAAVSGNSAPDSTGTTHPWANFAY